MARALLFVYGRLMHDYEPPASMVSWTKDSVRGFMFDRDQDPAIVRAGDKSEPWCEGELMVIDADELPALDEVELGYIRKSVSTKAGYKAWVYQYNSAAPLGVRRLERWASKNVEVVK